MQIHRLRLTVPALHLAIASASTRYSRAHGADRKSTKPPRIKYHHMIPDMGSLRAHLRSPQIA